MPKDTISRAYKACLSCRRRKVRCDIGDSKQPPCQRCRREMRDCNVPEERAWSRQTPGRGQSSGATFNVSQHGSAGLSLTGPAVASSPQHAPQQGNLQEAGINVTPRPEHSSSGDLEDTIIRTAVTSGNDALGLLFCDVRSGQNVSSADETAASQPRRPSMRQQVRNPSRTPLVQANDNVRKAWSSSKLGQMGWLRAHEVVSLLDSFFLNMAPFTPIILIRQPSGHTNHAKMISEEPLLCAVILMISSRYNPIPGSPSPSHAAHIHSCIWRYCQKQVTALIFGQSRRAHGSRTSCGIMMALLLLCEWHPRAFHFSPDADGLGGFAMSACDGDSEPGEQTEHEMWLSQIHEAVQCSDRMSTMLVGCTLTLGHELHVFDNADDRADDTNLRDLLPQLPHVRHLLYLYTHLLADKPSFTSLLPEKLSQIVSEHVQGGALPHSTHDITQTWLALSDLWKSFREMAPATKMMSASAETRTRHCLGLVDHFTSLLTRWGRKNMSNSSTASGLQKILGIEYNYVQLHCNSFGMQAEVEDIDSEGHRTTPGPVRRSSPLITRPVIASNYAKNVTTHCCSLLETIVAMHTERTLRYAPVRVFMRTVAASVLLLKTLAIGVRTSQLKSALDLLAQVVQALESSAVDDVHLARHYATLLDSCLQRARNSFVTASMRQPTPGWAPLTHATDQQGSQAAPLVDPEVAEPNSLPPFDTESTLDLNGDQWWALPSGPGNNIFSDIIPSDIDFPSFGHLGGGLTGF